MEGPDKGVRVNASRVVANSDNFNTHINYKYI